MRRWSFVLLALCVSGCAFLQRHPNADIIPEVDWPLVDLRALVVTQLPVGLAGTSPNQRELTSKHFRRGTSTPWRAADDAAVRYVAIVKLLGESRPYTIEVLVRSERRVLHNGAFRYLDAGHDDRFTKQLADIIRVELTKRRDDRNVIDDFRVF